MLHEQTVRSKRNIIPTTYYQRGVGLLEILITVLVLSVGLVGMATLMFDAVRLNTQSYQRTIAINLASDLADRIRNHQDVAKAGNFNHVAGNAAPATSTTAGAEIAAWLTDVANQLPSGQGGVQTNTSGDLVEFNITVQWDEDRDSSNGVEASYRFLTSL